MVLPAAKRGHGCPEAESPLQKRSFVAMADPSLDEPPELQFGRDRLFFKRFSHFLRALSELFLKFANQLVILAF